MTCDECCVSPCICKKIRAQLIEKACAKVKEAIKGRDFIEHDSHGYYVETLRFSIDPTPATIYKKGRLVKTYEPGTVLICNNTGRLLAEFNVLENPEQLDAWLAL